MKGSDIFGYELRVPFGLAQGMLRAVKSVPQAKPLLDSIRDPRSCIRGPRSLWL